MWYLMNSWKLLSENPEAPLKKFTPPFLLTTPQKIQKLEPPPFLLTLEMFYDAPAERGWGGHCVELIENLQVTQSNQSLLIKVKSV